MELCAYAPLPSPFRHFLWTHSYSFGIAIETRSASSAAAREQTGRDVTANDELWARGFDRWNAAGFIRRRLPELFMGFWGVVSCLSPVHLTISFARVELAIPITVYYDNTQIGLGSNRERVNPRWRKRSRIGQFIRKRPGQLSSICLSTSLRLRKTGPI
jgi:hypothetical protein